MPLSLLSAAFPTSRKAGAGMPEPIIIEKESLDDLNHANCSPCLRAGQSHRPISNNGFQQRYAKLGNAYWRAFEKTITGNETLHDRATNHPQVEIQEISRTIFSMVKKRYFQA